jgi:hypothetical protein
MIESLAVLFPLMLLVALNSFKKIRKAELFWVSIVSLLDEHDTSTVVKMLLKSSKNLIFFMMVHSIFSQKYKKINIVYFFC